MLPDFELLCPNSLSEASKMAKETGGLFLAGGTDLFVSMHGGQLSPKTLIKLDGIKEMKGVSFEKGCTFGALTTHRFFERDKHIRERFTALYEGCANVGSVQIRNRGTVGGNLCNAAPSADSAGPLLVLDARLSIFGEMGTRIIPLTEFYTGPKRTVLGRDELLVSIHLPEPAERSASAYLKYTRRNAMDLALMGVSAYIALDDDGLVETARLALTTSAPTPIRVETAEAVLTGSRLDPSVLREAARLAEETAAPRTSWRSSADFRRVLVEELTVRILEITKARLG